MLKMLVSVPVIMLCAVGGTVGILKLINHFVPGADALSSWFFKDGEK